MTGWLLEKMFDGSMLNVQSGARPPAATFNRFLIGLGLVAGRVTTVHQGRRGDTVTTVNLF